MRLDIAREVFDTGEPALLRKLVDLVIDGRHEWRPEANDAVYMEERRDRLPPDQWEFLKHAVTEAANPVPATPVGTARITLAGLRDIVSDLGKPAVLVLENRFNDGAFVRRMAVVFGEERIIEALDPVNDWLRLCHGGGTGQIVESAIAERKVFRMLVRVAVLIDSDRSCADMVSDYEPKVAEMLAAGVPEVHLLLLRMMENYLPMKVWDHHFGQQPHKAAELAALHGIAAEDRRYRHLKNHFFPGRRKQMPSPLLPDELTLVEEDFAELGEDVLDDLREVFAMISRIL